MKLVYKSRWMFPHNTTVRNTVLLIGSDLNRKVYNYFYYHLDPETLLSQLIPIRTSLRRALK